MLSFLRKILDSLIGFITRGKKSAPDEMPIDEAESSREKKLLVHLRRPGFFPRPSQILHLHHLLSFKERVVAAIATIVLIVGIILFGNSILPRFGTNEPARGGTYTEALIGSPILVNPLWPGTNDADRDVTRLIFSGLFRYNEKNELEPDVIERYEVSPDGKTYTFHLKQNLSWHDGVPLTASDVAFTINMIKNPSVKSPLANDFRTVSATAENDDTIIVTLESPLPNILSALTVGIIPENHWTDVPPEAARLAELNVKPIGSGPYRLKSLRKTKQGAIRSYTLEQNPYTYRARPYLDEITFKFYPDAASAVQALASGNADGLAFIPQELRTTLARKHDLVYHDLKVTQIVGLFFNQKQQPILGDKEVRAALAHATPRDAVIQDAFNGYADNLNGPLLAGTPGFTNDITSFDFNTDTARTMLEKDGWKLAPGKTVRTFVPKDKKDKRWSAGAELKLNLKTVNVPEYVQAAELIRDAWSAIGVEVTVGTSEPGKMDREVIAPRAYDVVLYGELLGSDRDPYPFWHSSQVAAPGVNLAGYVNHRVDALLTEARSLAKPEDRAARLTEFSKIVTSDIPAIFLLEPRYLYAVSNHVRGVIEGSLANPADRFASIEKWYTKTKFKW